MKLNITGHEYYGDLDKTLKDHSPSLFNIHTSFTGMSQHQRDMFQELNSQREEKKQVLKPKPKAKTPANMFALLQDLDDI